VFEGARLQPCHEDRKLKLALAAEGRFCIGARPQSAPEFFARITTALEKKTKPVILSEASASLRRFGATENSDASRMDPHFFARTH
jgi:hypothetical protein